MNLAALTVYAIIVGWIFITGIGLPPIPEEAAVAGLGAWIHHKPDALLVSAGSSAWVQFWAPIFFSIPLVDWAAHG